MNKFKKGDKARVVSRVNTDRRYGLNKHMAQIGDIITLDGFWEDDVAYCTGGHSWVTSDLVPITKQDRIRELERELEELKKQDTFFNWIVKDEGNYFRFHCQAHPNGGEKYSKEILSQILFDLDRLDPETTIKTLKDELSKFVEIDDDLPF